MLAKETISNEKPKVACIVIERDWVTQQFIVNRRDESCRLLYIKDCLKSLNITFLFDEMKSYFCNFQYHLIIKRVLHPISTLRMVIDL